MGAVKKWRKKEQGGQRKREIVQCEKEIQEG
jgi:hypothetical protein